MSAGAWKSGAVVTLEMDNVEKKAYVGAGFHKILSEKSNKSDTVLNSAKSAKNNDLFQSALDGEVGLLSIPHPGAGGVKNAPPGLGWGVCLAAQYGSTRQLFAFDNQGSFALCGYVSGEWSKWKVFAQDTRSITLLNGWVSTEAGAACEASKFGNRVTLTLSVVNLAASSGGTIAYLPWNAKKLTVVQTGTNFIIWLVGNRLYSSGQIAAIQYVTLNMSYETEE